MANEVKTTTITDDEFAVAAIASMPCPEGHYWRRAHAGDYSRRVKDGQPAMLLTYSGDDDSHILYLVTERQGGRA